MKDIYGDEGDDENGSYSSGVEDDNKKPIIRETGIKLHPMPQKPAPVEKVRPIPNPNFMPAAPSK